MSHATGRSQVGSRPGTSRSQLNYQSSTREEPHITRRGGAEQPARGRMAVSVDDYFRRAAKPMPHRFGKRVHNQPFPHAYESWDYLKHREEEQWKPNGGLRETKFHRGFQRKGRDTIFAAHNIEPQDDKFRPYTASPARCARLAFINGGHRGYNIINHESRNQHAEAAGDFPTLVRNEPVREKLVAHTSNAQLKAAKQHPGTKAYPRSSKRHVDPRFKFFQPRSETPNAKTRAKLLHAHGLPETSKTSSVLGYGRADLPSMGVTDNFGNSHWYKQASSSTDRLR
mmetsp:Transcript_939/g.1396  ORF Transcript_939/g.1396 Transcript_939/m.1396 type:complete len:284 (+) Transcript_939:126-977(+)|eukprot:CAMPEP_0184548048 /NCGR_PEP_ID=MMETSP0199_2-20130426/5960_1 /TAXON_ID=1112570 /ORGANISM="Thraustochytrium sp., Strain LLF1b" /LENGTH=283 /DNA_ID=CAMNT_0026942617 /DNA_START=1632 /DNA_END=2483 /DNA_ORIENTATION=-